MSLIEKILSKRHATDLLFDVAIVSVQKGGAHANADCKCEDCNCTPGGNCNCSRCFC